MPGILCEHCTAACCRYIALPIETPEDRQDFDDIRWYLLHDGISVFVEGGTWHIYIETDCRHLLPDHRCGIYDTRPKICRDYTAENCDYHSGDYGWEHHFTTPAQLTEHMEQQLAAKKRRHVAGRNGRSARAKMGARQKSRRKRAAGGPPSPATDLRGIPLPDLEERG